MVYKIAVIGSGISGLSASWALAKHHNVTLFEKNSRLGGHANTVTIDIDGGLPVDTGLLVVVVHECATVGKFVEFVIPN